MVDTFVVGVQIEAESSLFFGNKETLWRDNFFDVGTRNRHDIQMANVASFANSSDDNFMNFRFNISMVDLIKYIFRSKSRNFTSLIRSPTLRPALSAIEPIVTSSM